MSATTRELSQQAPRTGPWIIAYVASLGAVNAAVGAGIVTGPAAAVPFWVAMLGSTGMMIYTSWKRHRMLGSLSAAVRSFWTRFVVSAGVMFISYCLLAYGQMVGDWSASALTVVGLMPLVGFVGMIWSVHQYVVDETDGYLRDQAIRQQLIASFVTLIGATVWAGLVQMGLMGSGNIGLVVLIWFGGLGVGRLANELRP